MNWRPYFLNPPGTLPKEGVEITKYLAEKYGASRAKSGSSYLIEAGKSVGIQFVTEGRYVVDTLDSHRLVEFAKKQNKGNEMIEAIFHNYFEKCANINDHDVLAKIAQEAGFDPEQVKDFLKTDELKHEVISDARNFANVRGVPYFVLSSSGLRTRKMGLSGAQPPEAFTEVFEELCQA